MFELLSLVLLVIGGIGSLICWIMVLVKMFQNEKPLLGILGIFCGLWSFIWGWMKSSTLGLKKIMLIWSACIGISLVGNVLYGIAMADKIESGDYETIEIPTPSQ